jgi:hypothetical protein
MNLAALTVLVPRMNSDITTVVAKSLRLDDILNARLVRVNWSKIFVNPPIETLRYLNVVVAATRHDYYVNFAAALTSFNRDRARFHMLKSAPTSCTKVKINGRNERFLLSLVSCADDIVPFYDDLFHVFGQMTKYIPVFVSTNMANFSSKSAPDGALPTECGVTISHGYAKFTPPSEPAQYVQIERYILGNYPVAFTS